jgi:hypothetical protein
MRGVFPIILTILIAFAGDVAHATTFYSTSLESKACNSTIRNEVIDGQMWDSYYDDSSIVRCSPLTPPSGARYLEWPNAASAGPGVTPVINLASPVTIVSGTTYYLAGVWRFERISGLPIWHNTWDFDKLQEMGSSGTGFRWIIESGYPASTETYDANTYTFATYGSDAIFPGWTYYDHNINGYSGANPFRSQYSRWYSVVMGITAHQTNGRVRMWINGTQVTDYTGVVTMLVGATVEHLAMNGTIGQPEYDAPTHKRQVDKIMFTDNFADITAAGYLSDPEASGDTTPPAAPTGLGVN